MMDFASYEISKWQEAGVFIHAPMPSIADRPIRDRRVRPWNTKMLTGAFVLGVSSLFASPSQTQAASFWRSPVPHENGATADLQGPQEVPNGYWPSLVKRMANWKSVEDAPVSDFDALPE